MNIVLREKFKGTKTSRSDTAASYLNRITQVRDEFVIARKKVSDQELVRTALNGFTKRWSIVKGIVAQENLPRAFFCQRETKMKKVDE